MNDTTQHDLDEMAQRIADAISVKRAEPTKVHHRHHAGVSFFCLGRFGATTLVRASSPHELLARGAGFLAGLRFDCPIAPEQSALLWCLEGWD